MFGKAHDIDGTDTLDAIEEFFGDEAAAANAAEVSELHQRVEQVEAQISSQFTSLATYAQIAQEQVELARAEAKSATERSEQRVTSLIERERADRISSFTGEAPAGSAPDVMARIDAVEHSVAQIRKGLDECLQRQRSLADAITLMFERLTANAESALAVDSIEVEVEVSPRETVEIIAEAVAADEPMDDEPAPFASPSFAPPSVQSPASPLSGPIADLSLNA